MKSKKISKLDYEGDFEDIIWLVWKINQIIDRVNKITEEQKPKNKKK
jgi:hypothetical protein